MGENKDTYLLLQSHGNQVEPMNHDGYHVYTTCYGFECFSRFVETNTVSARRHPNQVPQLQSSETMVEVETDASLIDSGKRCQ